MKKILFSILLLGLLFSTNIQQTFAHVLQSDGSIGAVLHIDPNDDPIAGQQASLFFEFKDTTNRFTPNNCNCNVTIIENGHTIYAQPLFQNTPTPSVYNASVFYTFPQPDAYQVIVTGSPLSKNAFQSFKLTYFVRAEQPTGSSQTSPHSTFFTTNLGFVLGGILIVLLLIAKAISNYKHHKNIFPKS